MSCLEFVTPKQSIKFVCVCVCGVVCVCGMCVCGVCVCVCKHINVLTFQRKLSRRISETKDTLGITITVKAKTRQRLSCALLAI